MIHVMDSTSPWTAPPPWTAATSIQYLPLDSTTPKTAPPPRHHPQTAPHIKHFPLWTAPPPLDSILPLGQHLPHKAHLPGQHLLPPGQQAGATHPTGILFQQTPIFGQ